MARTHHSKVAVIESGEFVLAKALDYGENGGVDEANVGIGIACADVANSQVVARFKVLHPECAPDNVFQQEEAGASAHLGADQVVNFHQHRRRHHQGLIRLLQEPAA